MTSSPAKRGHAGGDGRRDDDRDQSRLPVEPDSITQTLDPAGLAVGVSVAGVELPVDETDREIAAEHRPGTARLRDIALDGVSYRMITASLPEGGAVQVARDLTETDAVLSGLARQLALIALLGTGVAALVGWVVGRQTTRPLRRLTETAEHVATTQDLSTPIEVTRSDEVGRLATSFNTMLEALDTSREQQHRLVIDASHELRTPLTSLRMSIELLNRENGLDDDKRERLLDRVTFELSELTGLVTELVELATDTRETDEPLRDVRLDEIVEAAVSQARMRTGRTIEMEATPTIVQGRPSMLGRAVRNLLANANKFSPTDAPVHITVGDGRVEGRDHGPGIPPEDRKRIFDRFYRTAAARTMPGSGLGLAIVDQIASAHGGRVWAGEAPGGGAIVGFEIPVAV